MAKYRKEILVSRDKLEEAAKRLGEQITRDYAGEEIIIVGVLKGCFIFIADLIRQIDLPVRVDFMVVSSYGNATESSGDVKIIKDLDFDIRGKHVLLVEDLIETGLTLTKLVSLLNARGPKSLEICTQLRKSGRIKSAVPIKYTGIDIPDDFIVGYGLDYAEYYRNLSDIYVLGDEEEKV